MRYLAGMRSRRRSPLFTAVVLAGASLTSGCGGTSTTSGGAADAKAPNDAALSGDAATADAGEDAGDAGLCPPGSERPTPPCALIR
jgi:hypothetical protein